MIRNSGSLILILVRTIRMSCIIKSPNQISLIIKFKSLNLTLSQNHLRNEGFIASRSIGGFLRLWQNHLKMRGLSPQDRSGDSREYSPRPRGENLLRQLYTYNGVQYRIQHSKPRLSTDGHQRHRQKREGERNPHTTVIKQSLSDYDQQDWPIMTKRSDF
jgi:hypothetical protein